MAFRFDLTHQVAAPRADVARHNHLIEEDTPGVREAEAVRLRERERVGRHGEGVARAQPVGQRCLANGVVGQAAPPTVVGGIVCAHSDAVRRWRQLGGGVVLDIAHVAVVEEPIPPRRTLLPFPVMSHAMLTRGMANGPRLPSTPAGAHPVDT